MLITLFIWSIGTAIMWYKGHRRLPLVDQPEVSNGWHAVMDLARAMEAEFRTANVDVTAMTDAKIKREVRKNFRGGSVSFTGCQLSRGEGELGPVVWAWLKKEKWWFGVMVSSTCVAFAGYLSGLLRNYHGWLGIVGPVCWSIGGILAVVLSLGTTLGSRVCMSSILALAVITPICIVTQTSY